MRRILPAALALLVPAAAQACAVCGAGGGGNRTTFLWTTLLLSILPLALLAGGLAFLWRAARGRLRDEFADPDTPRLPPEPAVPPGSGV
jgi:hypothetical protein